MYILTYLYNILPEISGFHLQLKCMGVHFFSGHLYIESTTVLSDNKIIKYLSLRVVKTFLKSTCGLTFELKHSRINALKCL